VAAKLVEAAAAAADAAAAVTFMSWFENLIMPLLRATRRPSSKPAAANLKQASLLMR